MVKENYGVLYVQMPDQLWSLDVCKLLRRPPMEETTRPRPEFEFMCNYQYLQQHPDGPRGCLPFGMKCMMVDSKLHMVGGYWENTYVNETPAEWANLDVYACEPIEGDGDGTPKAKAKEEEEEAKEEEVEAEEKEAKAEEEEAKEEEVEAEDEEAKAEEEEEGPSPLPSIRLCKSSTIPSLSGPKIDPIVVTLEDKIYVLSQSHCGCVREYWPALFEVFDPDTQLWNVLPNPPFARGHLDGLYIGRHRAWGHKLVVYPFSQDDETCIFDTREKKWENTEDLELDMSNVSGFAQYGDFIIGMSSHLYRCLQLVAYELDSNGIPNFYRVLSERDRMFCHTSWFEEIFYPTFIINVGDDGLMCFLYYGIDGSCGLRLSVGLFRIFTDKSEKYGWKIYARREAPVETYYLDHAGDGIGDAEIYSVVV